ncbi:acyl-CoA dehydrogenase family protein [Lentzea flaviverrucosa]|uniref:Acyl-CoA dehydrogenase n=1 Tax=Lentzea flaviverrucosa TaxID=200379 RepID=A0A1H9CK66_9PSEU|nr:acyl-CoA dehydrogenase family protein [Lentzea flaviverrucosa]RDI24572.1 alkylation response protein AidB-like acyl-CoA dehydrogenase [Lentzea flaviverrucosa]SEQ01582.1 Acyl-CoA dehydrogenase [Lentzea flaviverrucosa]
MDFTLTEAQRELAALTRKILDSSDTPWLDLVKSGVVPEQPDEFGVLEQCSVLVELGRAVSPVPYLPTTVAASALAEFGTLEQRNRWLKPGTVLSVALTEVGGVMTTVPFAQSAEAFLVAQEDQVFLVGADELEVTAQELVDGSEAGSFVHAGGEVVPGLSPDRLVTRYTLGLCALQLGVTERALELTAEYARTRVQFDRPIGSFQAVAQRLADAYIDVAAIRLTLWQAAWRLSEGLDAAAEVATAKFWAADAGHRVAHTAVHVHGGTGIDMSHDVHRYFTAAKRHEFELGGATAQLLKLSAVL